MILWGLKIHMQIIWRDVMKVKLMKISCQLCTQPPCWVMLTEERSKLKLSEVPLEPNLEVLARINTFPGEHAELKTFQELELFSGSCPSHEDLILFGDKEPLPQLISFLLRKTALWQLTSNIPWHVACVWPFTMMEEVNFRQKCFSLSQNITAG